MPTPAQSCVRWCRAGCMTWPRNVDPLFGLQIPDEVPDVPTEFLDPRSTGPTRTLTTVSEKSCARCSRRTFTRSARPARPPADLRIAIVGSRRFSEPTRVTDYVNALPPRASIHPTGSASRGRPPRRRQPGEGDRRPGDFGQLRRARRRSSSGGLATRDWFDRVRRAVAFWDGSSKGHTLTVERALDSGKRSTFSSLTNMCA